MPYDLIRRAGELSGKTAVEPPSEVAPAPEPAIEPAPEPAPRPPQPPHISHVPRGRPQSREVALDLARLRRAGMVTPDGDSARTLVEEFRRIKRPLLVKAFDPARRGRNANLIMVASARAGEGKSYIAQNLALSIAGESDAHVLLVDADLHRPSTPQRFGYVAELGLIDVLADDHRDLADVMLRTNIGKLSIVPPGKPNPRATELLASQRMARVVKDMAARYEDRVIIFDAPPVLDSTEPSVLAMHVGQVLFVVEADKTSRRAIEDSLALLESCPDISFVLNKRRKMFAFETSLAG